MAERALKRQNTTLLNVNTIVNCDKTKPKEFQCFTHNNKMKDKIKLNNNKNDNNKCIGNDNRSKIKSGTKS